MKGDGILKGVFLILSVLVVLGGCATASVSSGYRLSSRAGTDT